MRDLNERLTRKLNGEVMSYANKMVIELLRLGAYLQREGARVTREFGLAQQQFVVLVAVKEQGPVSQKAILSDLLYENLTCQNPFRVFLPSV